MSFNLQICGAHICYLVANASFEPFSSSANLCLIGADHCKYPRTYTSPEAIQRMEVYEFARVTGNSQFILLPFQPYKPIYASMLAEAGKINEALRYCQAVLKTLKTASHAADVCKEVAIALEEHLHIHSQAISLVFNLNYSHLIDINACSIWYKTLVKIVDAIHAIVAEGLVIVVDAQDALNNITLV
ncbi:hypothetical protein SELMODRAFT_431524 [Selaginella moellendorffii]|uniref:Sec16 Sec23-binding domain-containing protein n=1 Tax=Selaginella moellendorffii TaxID=88036 RepID=D8TCY2_SELML|nr:hypothetical protein SELMODRAFT_431524 [Selaginella moellendorffii]